MLAESPGAVALLPFQDRQCLILANDDALPTLSQKCVLLTCSAHACHSCSLTGFAQMQPVASPTSEATPLLPLCLSWKFCHRSGLRRTMQPRGGKRDTRMLWVPGSRYDNGSHRRDLQSVTSSPTS